MATSQTDKHAKGNTDKGIDIFIWVTTKKKKTKNKLKKKKCLKSK